ncbi:MAG: hypothetical protein R3A11_04455 [Bdellovibrionota bacterium]
MKNHSTLCSSLFLSSLLLMLGACGGSSSDQSQQGKTFASSFLKNVFNISGPDEVFLLDCVPFEIKYQEPSGNTLPVPQNIVVDVQKSSGVSLFSDNACTQTLTQVPFATGDSSKTFYLKVMQGLSGYVQSSVPSLEMATTQKFFSASLAPASSILYAGPSNLAMNQCTSFSLFTANQFGQTAAPSSNKDITLSVQEAAGNSELSTPVLQIYSDNSCSNVVTSVSFSTSDNTKTLYAMASNFGAFSLIASDPLGVLSTHTKNLTIIPSTSYVMSLVGNETPYMDKCVSYQLYYSSTLGQPAPAFNSTISIQASTSNGAIDTTLYSNSSCSQNLGTVVLSAQNPTKTIYVKTLAIGEASISYLDASGQFVPNQPSLDISVAGVVSVASGDYHSCALSSLGAVKCWGDGAYGQLGLGDKAWRGDDINEMGNNLPTVSLGTGLTAAQLAAGESHTCALLTNGQVKCWGRNYAGQLGLGNTSNRGDNSNEMGDNLSAVSLGTGVTATQIVAGGDHTCALLSNGQVKCWGRNYYGQLGLGDTDNRGDGPNEMGNNLPTVSLGTGLIATQISSGMYHSCALLNNGQVKCWGFNGDGELGLGDSQDRGDNINEMGDNLSAVSLGTGLTVLQLSTRGYISCVVLSNNKVKCWGLNYQGQLGLGDTDNRGDDSNEMGDNLPTLAFGKGFATQISVGTDHTCAILTGDKVKCWGTNYSGQLGLGDKSRRGDDINDMGSNLPIVDLGTGVFATQISSGGYHTCTVLNNHRVKCWGYNSSGQLGLGDPNDRGDNINEMGDNLHPVDLF